MAVLISRRLFLALLHAHERLDIMSPGVIITVAPLILDFVILELEMWVMGLVPRSCYNSAVSETVQLFAWEKKGMGQYRRCTLKDDLCVYVCVCA